MTETTLQQLQGATSDVQRTWIITRAILSSFPPVLQQAILAAGVPHWFNAVVLAELLEIDANDSENLLQVIQNLSFSEPFGAGKLCSARSDTRRDSLVLEKSTSSAITVV